MPLLRKAHRKLESARIDIEQALQEEVQDLGEIEPVEGAVAWIEKDNILRITVDECLPRGNVVSKPVKMRWINKIRRALLDVNIRFDSATIVIEVCSPHLVTWDTDNRAHSMIINAIRYMKIIPDDSYQHMSYMVSGKVDSDNPRTEIYILKHAFDAQVFVSKLENCY